MAYAVGNRAAGRHLLDRQQRFLFGIAERQQCAEDVVAAFVRRCAGRRTDVGAVGVKASWELDVWGRVIHRLEREVTYREEIAA